MLFWNLWPVTILQLIISISISSVQWPLQTTAPMWAARSTAPACRCCHGTSSRRRPAPRRTPPRDGFPAPLGPPPQHAPGAAQTSPCPTTARARSARAEGKDSTGDGASAGAAWSCAFVAPRPPSHSSHRVLRGFITGAGVETRLEHHLVELLEKPVLDPLKKRSQTALSSEAP